MRRKVLFGCLAAGGLFLLVLLTTFYFFVYRPTQEVMDDLAQIAALTETNERILDRTLYAPPPRLDAEQLERFARVQESMREALGGSYDLLAERAEKLHGLRERDDSAAPTLTIREAILLFKDLGPILTTAKDAQVEALNREGFSMSEYRWVRERFYRSLGFSRVDNYLEDFDAVMRGEAPEAEKPPAIPEVEPEVNKDLAAPYSDSSRVWFPFLVFGL